MDISSSDPGSQATITFGTGASVNINNAVIEGIKATGAMIPITATNSTDGGNNNNINFSAVVSNNLYWVGGSGNWNDLGHWAFSSGGAGGACIPTPNNS